MSININDILYEDIDNKKTIDILVIGNGFDLANGLETSYADFLEFCGEDGENISCECCSKIKELITNHRSTWFKYLYKLYKSNIYIGERWIDFESEISYILEYIDKKTKDFNKNVNVNEIEFSYTDIQQNVNKRVRIFWELIGRRTHYVTDLIDKLYTSLNVLIQSLEIWLTHISKNTEIKSKQFSPEFNISHIVSFNYTNVTEKVFPDISEDNKYFIHGKADITTNDCNLILGIDRKPINVGKLAIFNKDIQKINKNTNIEFSSFLFDIAFIIYDEQFMSRDPENMRIKVNLIFFGHSLDKADKSIINRLLNLDEFIYSIDLNIIIYIYEAKLKNTAIVNISEIIGQEKLNERHLLAKIDFRIIESEDKDNYMVTN